MTVVVNHSTTGAAASLMAAQAVWTAVRKPSQCW